ncbi:KRAB [Lepeophtheirus salmonis]|uniref:KRAB n=1 Tax=Lepeophtheirus salmonis TaxID=72036 RepID=A0A7R8CFB9_LEPSM|nr:KRAB [Lepeophtheirus salmonis]CAF2804783.1 KRAB [Lepeophtheirus salmonis]
MTSRHFASLTDQNFETEVSPCTQDTSTQSKLVTILFVVCNLLYLSMPNENVPCLLSRTPIFEDLLNPVHRLFFPKDCFLSQYIPRNYRIILRHHIIEKVLCPIYEDTITTGINHLFSAARGDPTERTSDTCDICDYHYGNTEEEDSADKTISSREKVMDQLEVTNEQPILKKNFTCDICKKDFTRKASLLEHLQRHKGAKDKECLICNKKFYSTSFWRHMSLQTQNP